MKRNLILALCLIAALGGCHQKKSHPAAPVETTVGPFLGVKSTGIKFSESIKGNQFSVQGRGCKTLQVALLHITAQDSSSLTEYTFTGMPETFEGNLWLVAQSGEAFGKKNQKTYTLGESLPAATKTQTSADPQIFEGPYTVESERADTNASLSASQ